MIDKEERERVENEIVISTSEMFDKDVLQSELDYSIQEIQHQQNTFKEFSREGMKMFRLLTLFIAIPATILGAFNAGNMDPLINTIMSSRPAIVFPLEFVFSMSQVFVSTSIAIILAMAAHTPAMGYEYRGIQSITNPKDMKFVNEHKVNQETYYKFKLNLLRDRISDNDDVLFMIESYLSIGKFLISAGILGAGVIFYSVATESAISWIWFSPIALLVFLSLIQLPSRYIKADQLFSKSPPYEDEFSIVYKEESPSSD